MSEVLSALVKLKDYVPLLQTVVWAFLIILVILNFKSSIGSIFRSLIGRIDEGGSVVISSKGLELKALQQLDHVQPAKVDIRDGDEIANPVSSSSNAASMLTPEFSKKVELSADEWSGLRNQIYATRRGIQLAHVITPSKEEGQDYDIYIFLKRHKSTDFSDIQKTEFFLGSYWGNTVYEEKEKRGLIGLSTSAYGPFLCVCRVTFKDGYTCFVERYIDFEMGKVFT